MKIKAFALFKNAFFFIVALWTFSFAVSAQKTAKYAPFGSISDLALIYDGGMHRKEWNEERFRPYVYAPREQGPGADWLFDGFLFLEIYDGDRCGFASGYRPVPAKKEDWLKLIDGYFSPDRSIIALDNCIENAKKVCGDLNKKRKVVISLPEPIPNQKDWGVLNGKKLDFSKDEDRIAACEWYIGYIITRFKDAGLKNVELGGFYWLAEEATHTRTFVKIVSDYIHRQKQEFYWIPYFKSDGYNTWKELGFDHAYLQPNHFFNDTIPDTRIDDACAIARQYGMSMELEFDETAVKKRGRGKRLEAYLEGFKRNKVFEQSDIAYYHGSDGLNALWNGEKEDRVLYYELINLIIERQQKKR